MVHNNHNNYTVLTDDQVTVIIVHPYFLLLLNYDILITLSILPYSMVFSSHAPLCKQPSTGEGRGLSLWIFRGDRTHTHTHTLRRAWNMRSSKHVGVSTGLLRAEPQMLRARDRLM